MFKLYCCVLLFIVLIKVLCHLYPIKVTEMWPYWVSLLSTSFSDVSSDSGHDNIHTMEVENSA